MSLLAAEVVVAGDARIWVASTDATAPDDSLTAMDSTEWSDVGFTSEDGIAFGNARTMIDIMAMQSFYAIRRIVSARDLTLAFAMRQWNGITLPFAMGGGEITPNGQEYTFTPPAPDVVDERSLALEWVDGERHYRLYFPRGMVTEATTITLARTAAADLPVTYGVVSDGTKDPFLLFTDDDAMAHVSGS